MGKKHKHMLWQMQETHAWPKVGNIWIGQVICSKKGGQAPPLLLDIDWQIHIFPMAKHAFPAFAQACVYVFCPFHVFMCFGRFMCLCVLARAGLAF